MAELRQAWTVQQHTRERLAHAVPFRDALRKIIPLLQTHDVELAAAEDRCQQAGDAAAAAANRVTASSAPSPTKPGSAATSCSRHGMPRSVRAAARTVLDGPGRLGLRVRAVNRAVEQLETWSAKWQPYLPDMPTDTHAIAYYAHRAENPARLDAAFGDYAHAHVARAHPAMPSS